MTTQHEDTIEQAPEQADRVDLVSAALADALVREAVGLAAVAVILLLMDQRTQIWVRAAARRAWAWARNTSRRPDAERAVAGLQRDLSAYEHGHVGGCGC